ncbi:MAG: hypothetical protein RR942_10385 [Romboutsia sp.]
MLESSIVYILTRTLPESLVLVLSGMIFLGNGIDIKRLLKKGILLGATIGIIRVLPINFGVHTILSMISFGVITFEISDKDIVKTMITTCVVWISLVLSEGIYVFIATEILKIPIGILMNNKSVVGALITLPSLIIILIIIFIFKSIKNKIIKSK